MPKISHIWRKSSRSGSGDACVEVKLLATGHIAVRDSKNPNGAVLEFTPLEWNAFVAGVKDEEFEL